MTELLSREREFLKINEELDKLTANSAVLEAQYRQHQHQQVSTANMSAKVDEQRFHTYTKTKGPSTLLKKRGAGDCGPDNMTSTGEGGSVSGQKPPNRCNNGYVAPQRAATLPTPSTRYGGGVGKTLNSRHDDEAATELRRDCGTTTAPGAVIGPRLTRNIRSPESSTRTYSRTSNRVATNNTTFTVKYRNPKFVESPSLEVLIKDETASLRQGSLSRASNSTFDAESVASIAVAGDVGNNGGTQSRRSHIASLASMPKKPLSTDGLIKFLKSRISILEEDHERLTTEIGQQREQIERSLDRHKKIEHQRDQAFIKNNVLTEQLAKVESQLEDANARHKDRLSEHSGQQKELDAMKRELKVLSQTNTNLEKRLYRANEDLENTKNTLALMKNSEREMKETMRLDAEGKNKQIKCLRKQRADLLNAYKKQLFLIDNLKRQNVCMEQSKMIGFGEKEFTKVLDWNAKA